MKGLGIGYEYLPEPGPVPVRLSGEDEEDRVVICDLLGYADTGGGWSGGIKAIIREPGQTWLRAVTIRRLQTPEVQRVFRRSAR